MNGLTTKHARALLLSHGANILPRAKLPGLPTIFFGQFADPLVYLLLAAGALSIFLGETAAGILAFTILIVNSIIGTVQEYSAQKSISALQHFIPSYTKVFRDGGVSRINSEALVPGDVIFLESGDKIPADVKLLETNNLTIDESLLTGESAPVTRNLAEDPENNHGFAGALVLKGRATAQVTTTGLRTKIGEIADSLTRSAQAKPPLMESIEKISTYISIAAVIFIFGMTGIGWMLGKDVIPLFIMAISLAFAAVPEGLPPSVTIALAIGVHRMSKSNVIIRKLIAVETLGSCSCIVSDKTGTLTQNKLTVSAIILPDGKAFEANQSHILDAKGNQAISKKNSELHELLVAGILANEAYQKDSQFFGDLVDIALLKLGQKALLSKQNLLKQYKCDQFFPYESENKYSAGIYSANGRRQVFLKGAYEYVLSRCDTMQANGRLKPINKAQIMRQVNALASQGYKVLAIATCKASPTSKRSSSFESLTLLGIIGIADPLRPEAKESIKKIQAAGVKVVMVTGDNPITAFKIAQDLGLNLAKNEIITGDQLRLAEASGHRALDKLVSNTVVFAHIEPLQKKTIVEALMRLGHYVAVTGDGVNDSPALKRAHIGVAMGQDGTDLARESSEIILTDNNFASIVEGIRQGRVVYNNIRKVIFFLISISVAELSLFALTLTFGLPFPLRAIQLLWLNFVISLTQDQTLVFEPPQGDELHHPPRKKGDLIFNKFLIGRVLIDGLYMGCISFGLFYILIANQWDPDAARNLVLLMMVLFCNFNCLISKSEYSSFEAKRLFDNKFLFCGIFLAQLIHIAAMHIQFFEGLIHLRPVSFTEWGIILIMALSLFAIDWAYRAFYKRLNND